MLTANATAIPLPVTTKTCSKCNVDKPFSEFGPDKRGKLGLYSQCNPCKNEARRKSHANRTPEQIERKQLNSVWDNMINRCHNTTHKNYKNYGGRGITVYKCWRDSLDNFISDMGPRPAGYELDRRNNDGNYEPENCRWVTASENCHNKRHRKNSTGVTGVFLQKNGRYKAQMTVNGTRHQKYSRDRWDAISYRMSMENRYRETGAL